jgi:hypothetical protein
LGESPVVFGLLPQAHIVAADVATALRHAPVIVLPFGLEHAPDGTSVTALTNAGLLVARAGYVHADLQCAISKRLTKGVKLAGGEVWPWRVEMVVR